MLSQKINQPTEKIFKAIRYAVNKILHFYTHKSHYVINIEEEKSVKPQSYPCLIYCSCLQEKNKIVRSFNVKEYLQNVYRSYETASTHINKPHANIYIPIYSKFSFQTQVSKFFCRSDLDPNCLTLTASSKLD